MKVVAITGKQACEIVDRPDPRIKGDFVKVAIRSAPMCTEVGEYRNGSIGDSLGHEAAGEVVEIAQPGQVAVGDARCRGARVIALESNEYRASLARKLGVEAVVDPRDEHRLERILELTGGCGADKSVETSSAETAPAFLIQATRRKGQISSVGWGGPMMARDIVGKGLTIHGTSRCGNPAAIHEHVRVGAHFEKGRVEWQQFGAWEIVRGARRESGRCFTTEKAFGENWTWEQAEFHKAMFAWLEDDTRPAGTNLKRSLHEWAVVLALYQSALERRPVSMADFHPPLDLVDQYKSAMRPHSDV